METTDGKVWNLSIQIGKLIAACFVVFIHVMLPGAMGGIAEAVARFSVPFFFAISGYFSYRLSAARIRRRAVTMLRLIIIATLICFTFDFLLLKITAHDTLSEYLSSRFSETSIRDWLIFGTNPISEHLWYLNAAFGCYVIFGGYTQCTFERYGYRPLYHISTALLITQFLLGSILPLWRIRFSYQFYRNTLLLGLPMFTLGLYIREHQDILAADKRFSDKRLCLYMCIGTVCSVIQRILFYEAELPFGAVLVAGSLMLLTAVHPIPFSIGKDHRRISEACGRISLVIYVIHPSVNHLLSAVIGTSAYLQPFIIIAISLLCGVSFIHIVKPRRTGMRQ